MKNKTTKTIFIVTLLTIILMGVLATNTVNAALQLPVPDANTVQPTTNTTTNTVTPTTNTQTPLTPVTPVTNTTSNYVNTTNRRC